MYNWLRRLLRLRQNPVGQGLSQPWERQYGTGSDWSPTQYSDYQAQSVGVYAAIKIRADAVARIPFKVYRQVVRDGKINRVWVGPEHPAQSLLDAVNPHWTRGQLWRATETYLNIWGSAFWFIRKNAAGIPVELWPLRPDRVKIVPDPVDYIRGYTYTAPGGKVTPFLADEIVRIYYFNAADEYAGLSPLAAVRLSVDMGRDALRSNRNSLTNDSTPGLFMETSGDLTEEEAKAFYQRWESRFQGVNKVKRPALLSGGLTAKSLGFSPKDMEYLSTLRYSLEEVARAFNVPMPMLHDLSRATYANVLTARRSMWEDCLIPQTIFYQETLQEYLVPHFRDPSLVIEADLSKVEALQEDEDKKAARRKTYIDAGIMTPNEIRAEMGLPESGQPEADLLKIAGGGAPVMGFSANGKVRAMPWIQQGRDFERAALKTVQARETEFTRMLRALYLDQHQAIIKRLNEHRDAHPTWRDSTLIRQLLTGQRAESDTPADKPVAVTGGLKLFDPHEWEPVFFVKGKPIVTKAVETGGKQASAAFKLGIDFDVDRPLTQQWIVDRTKFWARRTNETTANMVTEAVRNASEQGMTVPELADELAAIKDINLKARTVVAARTEMASAQNQGHLEAYKDAGAEGKQWLTSIDGRERDSHHETHMQIRRVDEDFDIGGEGSGVKAPAPVQSGVPEEDINCRCVALPRVEL